MQMQCIHNDVVLLFVLYRILVIQYYWYLERICWANIVLNKLWKVLSIAGDIVFSILYKVKSVQN